MLARRPGGTDADLLPGACRQTCGMLAPALLMLAVLAATDLAGAQEPAEASCRVDSDCKLIYSSCSCVAVPVHDPRNFLPANVDCAANRCRTEHVRATCVNQVCEPASKDPARPVQADADGRPDTNK